MKRALIISYYWPPTGGSGVQRWVKFAKNLPAFGWQPVVYTPENPEQLAVDSSLLEDIPPECEVIKTHITEPYELARRFMGGGSAQKGAGVNPVNAQQKSFKQRAALWVRGNCFVPDPRVWWVRPSVKFLTQYLKAHPVDVMVTTGPPQSMHLIGLELHRTLGIPWVADFRDPWTQMFYFKHLGLGVRATKLHHQMEQAVLDGATAVVAVSPLVQADFAAQTSTPVHLITNGYDEADFAAEPAPRTDGVFRLVHTGLFASDGNPTELWRALAELKAQGFAPAQNMQLRLAGKVDPEILEAIRAHGLQENLVNLGYVPHEQSVAELRGADLAILPLRKEPEYRKVLPGKIFEYLAAGKPVLGIGQEDGAAAMLLKESGAGTMLDWQKGEQMKEFIARVALGQESGAKSENTVKYSRRALTGAMVELFENIAK